MSGKHGQELLESSLTWNFPFAPHNYKQPPMTYTGIAPAAVELGKEALPTLSR
jgi:hypothetical protein